MLTPGTSLGPYRIVSRLGTGGMGEVYRARDTRLERDVAIKILPDSVALSPESSRRFEQEARAVALLSHPNLLAIHDVGRHEGRLYAVMELLEGQTLLERLEAGPIPLRKTLDWALQLAQGLAAAHDRGIVHRDLKPENVFITRDGHVKILDFGLARTLSGDRPSRLTGPGLVVGTMGYMSPEQLKGMEVDGRADIFSFGCVLYEMLSGREAFRRETDAETIAAVLKEDPPEIPAEGLGTPLVDRVLRRALEKEPDDRFRSAHDLAFALKAILDGSVSRSSATALTATPEPPKRARLGNAIAAALALFAAGVLVGRLLPRPSPAGLPGMRLALPLPPGALSLAHDPGCIAISPDGKTFVYTATSGATSVLVRHALDGSGAAEIPGTEGGDGPFFSPDGRWVGFFRGGQLFKVALDGGKPFLIAKAPNARGAFWAKGDDIFFAPTNYGPLARVPAAGGDPRVLTELDAHGGERSHRWPALLPDGDTLVFAVGTGGSWDAARIVAQRVSSGERKVVIEGGTSPVFLHPGVLVFARAGSLFAVPFDARKLAVVGSPVEVAGDVLVSIAGRAEVALSAAGSLVAVPAGAGIDRQTLAFASRSGDLTPATREPEEYPSAIRLSRDGRHVLAATSAGLELVDLARGTATPLTTFESGSRAINPVLDATGRRILFASEKNGPWNIFSMPVDGGARPERLWASERTQVPLDASKEGLVLFSEGSSDSLFVRPADASAPEVSVGASAFTDDARLSPDGRYVAYAADESGRRPEIYVKAIPGRGAEGRIQVSAGGGRQARWKSDGTALYFQSGDALVEVPVTLGEEPSAGSPRVLFRASFRWFEPSAAGFLLALSEDPAKRPAPVVVVGWESAVKNRLAPAAK